MHVTNLALAALSLTSGALSFKIRAFSGNGCTGSAREINVYDNTCRNTDVPTTRSFRVLAYGASRQRAYFYTGGSCVSTVKGDWWADGGSNVFKKDACITLPTDVNAYGSWSR